MQRTLNSEDDLKKFCEDLSQKVREAIDRLLVNEISSRSNKANQIASVNPSNEGSLSSPLLQIKALASRLKGEILGTVGQSTPPPPGDPSTSVTLFGDISEFLPMEDRIRVVSWVER